MDRTIRQWINGNVYTKQLIDDTELETTSPPCQGAVTAAEVGRVFDELRELRRAGVFSDADESLSAIEADVIRRMLGMTPSGAVAEQPAPPNAGDMNTKTAGGSVNFGKLDWGAPDFEDVLRWINRAGQVAQIAPNPTDWEEYIPGVWARHVEYVSCAVASPGGWNVVGQGNETAGPETGDLGRECADHALVRLGVLPSSRAFVILSDWMAVENGCWVRRGQDGAPFVHASNAGRAVMDADLVAEGKLSRDRAHTESALTSRSIQGFASAMGRPGSASSGKRAGQDGSSSYGRPVVPLDAREEPRMNDWSGDATYPEASYGRSASRVSTDLRVSASVSALGWVIRREGRRVAEGKESGVLGQECADDVLVKLGHLEPERAVRLYSDWVGEFGGGWTRKAQDGSCSMPRSPRRPISCWANQDDYRAESDAELVARGELAPSRAFKAGSERPVWEPVLDSRSRKGHMRALEGEELRQGLARAHEKDLANAAYHGSASVLSAIPKPANPLYDQDTSPIYPGIFVEVSPPIENADAMWEVRAVNYTMGTATLRQPRGQSWRLADVALGRLATVPKPTTWNALAGLANWERTLAAIMANPPKAALEMGQKKGVAWERFLVALADVHEVISWRAGHAKEAAGSFDYLRDEWSVGAVLEWIEGEHGREYGLRGVGYPGQQRRDFTPRATR